MRWYQSRLTVSWLMRNLILFSAVAVYGQEPIPTDPALQVFFPYRQGVLHATEVEVGMWVDQSTAQQVAAALPTEIRALVEKGELTFSVQDTTDLPPSEEYVDATRQHYHKVEIEGGKLKNYVAGMPFPLIAAHDPQAGEKVMWNFRYRDRGDSEEFWGETRSLTATGALDRLVGLHGAFRYGMHRPAVAKNIPEWEQEGVYYKFVRELTAPPDVRGSITLTLRHDDDMKLDSEQFYDVQVRRVRPSPANHLASPFGFFTLQEDSWGFSGYLRPYRWRFIGEQSLLVPGLAKTDHVTLGGRGGWYPTGQPWELRQVYVVEGIPVGSHPYARRVLYVDKQTANVLYILIFNSEGQHWRTIFRSYAHPDFTPWNKGQQIWVALGHCWIDHVAERATVYVAEKTVYNQPLSPQLFTRSRLLREEK